MSTHCTASNKIQQNSVNKNVCIESLESFKDDIKILTIEKLVHFMINVYLYKDVSCYRYLLLVFPPAVKCRLAETCRRISVSFYSMYLCIYHHTFKNIRFIFLFLLDIFIDFVLFFMAIKKKLYAPTWAWPNHPTRPAGKFRWKPSFCRTTQKLTDARLAFCKGAGLPN